MLHATSTLLLIGALSAPAMAAEPDSRAMEILLAKSLQSISNNRLDLALSQVDSLLSINPNFKLAQLVRGDLLLARTQALNSFGSAPNAPRDQLNDFREEARARLQRVQQVQPIGRTPKYLWQLDSQQRYIIVVDTSKSTLYLYENANGKPRYVTDFYISVGKKGIGKVSEGDQRTPLGVYFVNGKLPRNKLPAFYGPDAYPISYPNEWDQRQGRDGHGIWLHGTPNDTYSRPPKASNGCVVLTNRDLLKLGKLLQIGLTPVIITSKMDWSDEADQQERHSLMQALEQWRTDWSSRNVDAFLAHYANDFSAGKVKLTEFSQQKRQVNASKSWVKVKLTELSVFAYPNQSNLVVVNFEQDYSSNNLSNKMKKRQYWLKRYNQWQIIYEGSVK